MPLSPRSFYAGVFAISAALMALQIVQTRIFSVTTWYHLSFLVISVAMFGLTMGALGVHRGDEKRQRAECGALMARACLLFGFCVPVALLGQMTVPIVSDTIGLTLVTLPLMSVLVIPPYYAAGVALSLAITRAPFPTGRTYGVDLIGAAAGCLLALGLMEMIDAPSALLLLALSGLGAAFCFSRAEARRGRVFAACLAAALLLNCALPQPFVYPRWVKNGALPQSELDYDEWNAISRVVVRKEQGGAPYLWGPSSRTPPGMDVRAAWLQIDGDAGTLLTRFGGDREKDLAFLDYDLSTIAYALPGLRRAAIIGVGGGRDVLTAYHNGIDDITALDVNDIQISLLSRVEPFRSMTNLSVIPGLKLVHSEARSWFSREKETFDIIQMSMIDTWAATGAGAFALSENGLYTVEAWKTFLSRLNPGGVLTVSRWYLKDAPGEVDRLISLATAAVLESGAQDAGKHVFLAASQLPPGKRPAFSNIATLVLSRDPLTARQAGALEKRARDMDFRILLSPGRASDRNLSRIMGAKSRAALDSLVLDDAFDISPPTDARPFFFNQVRLTRPLQVVGLVQEDAPSAAQGHAKAALNLYIILSFSLLMVVTVILLPLRDALKRDGGAFTAAGTAWFLLIGLGFMFIEIALLQRMSIYLGHPSYSLGIVLFSLVLSTGAGSLMSDRAALALARGRVLGWAACAAGVAAATPFLLGAAIHAFPDAALGVRALLCVAIILPLGFMLGFGFPTGMALAERKGSTATAWFWGINGAAGVMGSALAIALNITWGLDRTMLLGALCYALLGAVAWMGFPARGKAV